MKDSRLRIAQSTCVLQMLKLGVVLAFFWTYRRESFIGFGPGALTFVGLPLTVSAIVKPRRRSAPLEFRVSFVSAARSVHNPSSNVMITQAHLICKPLFLVSMGIVRPYPGSL